MGNLSRLMDAGIIAQGASLSQEDQDVINSLSSGEVDALISVKGKLTPGFIQRNLSGSSATRGEPAIGIVF